MDSKRLDEAKRWTRVKGGEVDYVLAALFIAFYGIGLVMVFSASLNEGIKMSDPLYFLKRQGVWTLFSLFAFLLFAFVDYRALVRARKALIWIIIVMLAFLLFPRSLTGGIVHPSRRWYRLFSFGFQPSEFAKVVLIVYLAHILSKKGEQIRDFYRGFLPPFLVVCAVSLLVFLQPDFSTAFLLFFIAVIMFFVAGLDAFSIVSLIIVAVPALYLMVSGRGYRADRIIGFINPWMDPTDKGYQIIQSFKAFAYGGFTGAGLGRSIQKMKYLPIPHTDYIYAIIVEETGFLGALLVIGLYMIFAYRGFVVAFSQRESLEFFLAFGITSTVVWGALVNIGVVTGLLPSTGLTLPFISYGGSSLLSNSIMGGILLNLSRNRVSVRPALGFELAGSGGGGE